ncbi:MAG: hypothetical protein ACREXS_17085 [Gammaproteobacteria bacterium]
MSDTVLIPFGHDLLMFSVDEIGAARERGRKFMGAPQPDGKQADKEPERLLTAEEMESRTKVPATWYLEQARQGRIPHVRLGKYVRFVQSEVLVRSRFRRRESKSLCGATKS